MKRLLPLLLHSLALTHAFIFPAKFGFLKRNSDDVPFSPLRLDTQDDTSYLESEFQKLQKGDSVDYKSFVASDEVQSLLAQRLLSKTEVKKVWMKCVEKVTYPANFEQFVQINKEIDNLFEEEEDGELDMEDSRSDASFASIDTKGVVLAKSTVGGTVEEDASANASNESGDYQDPWDPTVRTLDLFEEEYMHELQRYFTSTAVAANPARSLLSFEVFCKWSHVTDLLQAGSIDRSCLYDIWQEAMDYQYLQAAVNKNPSLSAGQIATSSPTRVGEKGQDSSAVGFDTFVRAVYRLEAVVQDIQEAVGSLGEEEVEGYYRSEFRRLCGSDLEKEDAGDSENSDGTAGISTGSGARGAVRAARQDSAESDILAEPLLLSWSELLQWEVVREMLHSKEIAEADLRTMWEALPKQRVHRRGVVNRTGRGFGGDKGTVEEWGIGEDAFVVLNSAIADILAVK